MALLALTSLYAGSAGLTLLRAPVVGASTDLLKRKRWATSWRDARDEIGAGLGSARWFAVVRVDGGGVEGACWDWRAVRRHRFALDRSRPLKSVVLGSPLRVMPAAATSACVSLLIDVRGPVGVPAFCSRLVLRAASGGGT